MQINPRQIVTQFAHVLQNELFPILRSAVGPLSARIQLLAAVVSMIPLERALCAHRAATGRPAKDRTALATAFIAKAVLNLPTTRDLISRLRVDEALRQLCGWPSPRAVPHESKFSRAFAEFALSELPQQLHQAVIASTQEHRLIGHVARDSTAIPARERLPETAKQKAAARRAKKAKKAKKRAGKQAAKQSPPKGSPRVFDKKKADQRGTRIQRQRRQKLAAMLQDMPRQCDIGAKKNSQGHEQYWRGFKLHLDVADGQLPVSAILTSASVRDSQVAIPLMTITSSRVAHLYELMDSAYDADSIHAHSRAAQSCADHCSTPPAGHEEAFPGSPRISRQAHSATDAGARAALQDADHERTRERPAQRRIRRKPDPGAGRGEGNGAPHVRGSGIDR